MHAELDKVSAAVTALVSETVPSFVLTPKRTLGNRSER